MSAQVITLPTANPSFYTVRKFGRDYHVQLVTPAPFKALRTSIARYSDKAEAIAHARDAAQRTRLAFKERG